MATLTSLFPTLVDIVARLDPRGGVLQVAEVLNQYNPMLDDIAFVEGNLPTGHRVGLRTALPTPVWRRLNQGIDPQVSKTDVTDEPIGMMENYSKIDVDVAAINGNSAAFRLSEDKAFIQGFNIQLAQSLIYESQATAPERFTGLTPRLNSTTANESLNSKTPSFSHQLVLADASASGNNQSSIWLVGWSPETVFAIYPKGSVGGLITQDLGQQLVLDSNSKQFLALVTRFQWKVGLCVKDYRFVSRQCNIDTTRWKADLSQGADLALSMQDQLARIFSPAGVKLAWYMNRQTYAMLNKQLVKRQANWLEWITGPRGDRIPSYFGAPIRISDALTMTEAVVS